jgi:hypothetical protein
VQGAFSTVTVKLQLAVLFDASLAVQFTVDVPIGKQAPDAGAHTTVVPAQLSVTVGIVKVTAAQL